MRTRSTDAGATDRRGWPTLALLLGVALLLALSGCLAEQDRDNADPDAASDACATGTAEFPSDINAIFAADCTSCHPSVSDPSLEIDAYCDVVDQPSGQNSAYLLVEPGNSVDSYLYMKITGDGRISGSTMGSYVDGADITAIGDWIDAGALSASESP